MKVDELKTGVKSCGGHVDPWLRRIHARFDKIEEKFDRLERQIGEEEAHTRRHISAGFQQLSSQLADLSESIAASTAAFERRLRPVESEHVTLLSALSDHELACSPTSSARTSGPPQGRAGATR